MSKLTKKTDTGPTWYPVPISKLDNYLEKVIRSGQGYHHSYALRRNIAYNLQYIEYLDRSLIDLKLSQVLITQTWKTFVIVGCGIVESVLHYLLVADGSYSKTEWEIVAVAPGNQKKLDGEIRKIDSHIYRKLSAPRVQQMTFDAMLKKAEPRQVLGGGHGIYPRLKRLRPLRNRIHLQEIGGNTDTDWNSFKWSDACAIAQVLHSIFTSSIFHSSSMERAYFEYLLRYSET